MMMMIVFIVVTVQEEVENPPHRTIQQKKIRILLIIPKSFFFACSFSFTKINFSAKPQQRNLNVYGKKKKITRRLASSEEEGKTNSKQDF
jgi:hypothetical protein